MFNNCDPKVDPSVKSAPEIKKLSVRFFVFDRRGVLRARE